MGWIGRRRKPERKQSVQVSFACSIVKTLGSLYPIMNNFKVQKIIIFSKLENQKNLSASPTIWPSIVFF